MEDRTTIQLPRPLVARLKQAREKGETYADVIDEALVALKERRRFIRAQIRVAEAARSGREPSSLLE